MLEPKKVLTLTRKFRSERSRFDLQYDPVGSDTVAAPVARARSARPQGPAWKDTPWSWWSHNASGGVARFAWVPAGTFVTEVHADRGRKCEYDIVLCNASGTALPIVPNRFGYTIGMVISGMPLQHSIGVAMANNETDFFLRKGESLPARKPLTHQTVQAISRGQTGEALRIPIIEGENRRADRNRRIQGSLLSPLTSCDAICSRKRR